MVPLLGVVVVALIAANNVAGHGASTTVASQTVTPAATAAAAASGPCQFQKADQPLSVALCETFDAPAGTGNRSGDLNGTLWGVSRQIGNTNFGQAQYQAALPTVMQKCGTAVAVQPANDVAICNGQVAEAVTDDNTVTGLAMYPKQPFDIGGRTGTITFDVSDDTHGNHRAWPELWYTDQPVPAPFDHFSSLQSVPKNGFGVRFANYCPPNQASCGIRPLCPSEPADVGIVSVDSANVVNNYVSNDSDIPGGSISVNVVGCVKASSGPGDMNHFEVRVSTNEIDVYGTDAGNTTGPMTKLAVITNAPLSLTRGVIWMEDVHYNGNKDGPDQGTHTFTWDNVGFDGPVLPRDLTFDVLDNNQPSGRYINLGWPVAPLSPVLTVPGVQNIANAAGALLTVNYFTAVPVTLSYRVNNHGWHDQPWPFGACSVGLCENKTIAMPLPLSELQAGRNTVQFESTDPATAISSVDIVLLGAGGPTVPGGYRLVASDGGIFSFGNAGYYGSTGAIRLNQPIVGMASTPSGRGYWLVASDGGIFTFGDAGFYGSTGNVRLNKPVVAMAATPSGRGYWLVASDGGIFTFGDAGFYGSTGNVRLNKPVVAMAATPSGRGYRLTASDGGIFTFGDAGFYGSTGAVRLNQPIVAMAASPTGRGYRLVASDGGIFTFGDAGFYGSAGNMRLANPVVAMATSPTGRGYWLVASDGGIFSFGDAAFFGSTGNIRLNQPVVAIAATP